MNCKQYIFQMNEICAMVVRKPGGCFARNVGHWFDNQTHNGRHREGAFADTLANKFSLPREAWWVFLLANRKHGRASAPLSQPMPAIVTAPHKTAHHTHHLRPSPSYTFQFWLLKRSLNSPALCLDGIDGSVQLINTQISVLTQLPVFRRKPLYSETAH